MTGERDKRRFGLNGFGKYLPAATTLFPAVKLFTQLFVEPGHEILLLGQWHNGWFVQFAQNGAVFVEPN